MATSAIDGWKVQIEKELDVLGPFPIQAREQHFLSPAFPLNLSQPLEFSKTWPSSFADGGHISWSQATVDDFGRIQVSFPHIRWDDLRATEGWAALQHHSVIRAKLTLHPPQSPLADEVALSPNVLVSLTQGSFFTLAPSENHPARPSTVAQWYSGNIYAMGPAPPQVIPLPTPPSAEVPTTYDLYISGDYEIRLFGDPRPSGTGVPMLDITVAAHAELPIHEVVHDSSHDVTCDFVDGWSVGDALGIGLRSVSGWWTVTSASLDQVESSGMSVTLLRETRLAPGQTRILALQISQSNSFVSENVRIRLSLDESDIQKYAELVVTIPIKQRKFWAREESPAVKASYLYEGTMPTSFIAIPPLNPSPVDEHPIPPILALHGAGVDILTQPFWSQAIPRQSFRWIIIPTGRTSWGLDWHGPSAMDAWQCVDALQRFLANRAAWSQWKFGLKTKVIIMGHSNGGQGTWYLSSRYPDRVLGAVPAAAYIKAQAYVPLTLSRSSHFIDPSLRAVLESSFTPDDNDLFFSNLVHTPILAIHGGEDENVPTWHTGEAVSVLKTWNPDADVKYREDPAQPHWYPSVFHNDEVQHFLDMHTKDPTSCFSPRKFTLTVASPGESGSFHGWSIESVEVLGRLSRLSVEVKPDAVTVKTSNVHAFRIASTALLGRDRLVIDGISFEVGLGDDSVLAHKAQGIWKIGSEERESGRRGTYRLSAVLQSSGTLLLVIPDQNLAHALSVALRIAHNLNLFHKLDAGIIPDSEAVRMHREGTLPIGSVVVIGSAQMVFPRICLDQSPTAFSICGEDGLQLKGKILERSEGAIFLHPHPTSVSSNVLFMLSEEASSLERLAKLFPTRTGISLPDWIVISEGADKMGAAGIRAAGIWNEQWGYNDAMSWHN